MQQRAPFVKVAIAIRQEQFELILGSFLLAENAKPRTTGRIWAAWWLSEMSQLTTSLAGGPWTIGEKNCFSILPTELYAYMTRDVFHGNLSNSTALGAVGASP